MDGLGAGGTSRRRGPSRHALASLAVLALLSLLLIAVASIPALADDTTDPPTTTEPAPDTTTPPDTIPDTTPPTDPPVTTVPTDPTTTLPGEPTTNEPDTTTTTPSSTTTTEPGGAPNLDPDEALQSRPEFASLSARQRSLVDQLQQATDAYAFRRFAQVGTAHQLQAAKDVLVQAKAVESAAVTREIVGLAEAGVSADDAVHGTAHGRARSAALDRRLETFRALRRRYEVVRKDAKRARMQAESTVADLNDRFTKQTRSVKDALSDRAAAESAIEDELGSDAVRARPDGITATLLAAQAGQPDPIVVGGLGSPIPGAALASPFGLRNDPLGGGAGFHPGIDLEATSGTPIHAAADGVVVTAGDCGGYGNCVVIDHGNSIATLSAHQSQVLVSVGEHVDAGQVIGLVGSTGMATGPHLHFEVRLHGVPIDPLLALSLG